MLFLCQVVVIVQSLCKEDDKTRTDIAIINDYTPRENYIKHSRSYCETNDT